MSFTSIVERMSPLTHIPAQTYYRAYTARLQQLNTMQDDALRDMLITRFYHQYATPNFSTDVDIVADIAMETIREVSNLIENNDVTDPRIGLCISRSLKNTIKELQGAIRDTKHLNIKYTYHYGHQHHSEASAKYTKDIATSILQQSVTQHIVTNIEDAQRRLTQSIRQQTHNELRVRILAITFVQYLCKYHAQKTVIANHITHNAK